MSVEYNDNSIYITPPASSQEQELAYVRPGDTVNLEFSVENAKLEISNGDLVFSLPDGGRVILVSLVEMSFSENPPVLTDSSGSTYSVSDLVTSLEVVRQSEAVLIITQVEDTDKNAEEKPTQVISASEQDGSDISGSPSGGDGNIAYQTEGSPTDKVNPLGVVPGAVPYAGLGIYPATPNRDNAVGSSDSDSTLPGDINYEAQNSLNITYYYGDTVVDSGTTNISGTNYNTIIIESGSSIRNEDPQVQILPSDINAQLGDFSGTSNSYFINARYKNDKIIRAVSVDYEGFKPVSITLSNIPTDVTIESTSSAVIRQNTDGTYSITQIPPGGDLTFNIIYDSGRPDEAFNMEYGVLYYDEYGEAVTFTYNQNIKFRSVSDASVFEGSDIIFSTDAGGIQVTTSAGNFSDIIVGGGAQNIVSTNGGNDYYFSGAGQDYVNLGDGDDIYYGNTGLDIVTGGSGTDTIRFDNADAGLTNFDNTLYNTYIASQGMNFYMGASKAYVGSMATLSTDVKANFADGDVLINTSEGQVIKGFEVFYGTHYSDTFYIGSVGLSTNTEIFAVDGAGTDTLSFDLWATGISLDITSQAFTVGSGTYTFHDFDVYKGSAHDDTFTSSVTVDLNGITIDGGDGTDTLSYAARSEALVFDAFTSVVYDSSETYSNSIRNFEILVGSSVDDIFRGSTNTHLFYQGGAGTDELTYLTAKAGVSFDAMSNRVYKVANESFLYGELDTKAAYDEFDNTIESLVFTKSADVFYFSDTVTSASPVFTTIDGLEGLDVINLVDVNNANVSLDWNATVGLDGLNYNHSGSAFTLYNVERIRFGDGDDTFTINSMNTGQSYYVFGGDGVDTIDFGALTSDKSVAFDLSSGVATITGGSAGNIQFSELERFLGSQGDDIYYVSDSLLDGSVDAKSYELNGNAGFDLISFRKLQVIEGGALIFDATSGTGNPTIEYGGEAIEFNLVSIEGIEGTAYDDIFKINYNSNLDVQNTTISGSDGKDTLELVVAAGDSVVLNLYEGKVGGDRISSIEIFNGLSDLDDTVIMTSGDYQIDAGAGTDTVDFSHLTTYVVFDFKDNGQFLATVGSNLSQSVLSNFEVIVGTRSDDTFKLAAENTSGADITYSIDGGLGNNRISFENSSVAITGFSLNDTGSHVFSGTNSTTYNWQNITSFTFTDQNDEIISNQADASFTVVGGDGIDKIIYSGLTSGIVYQMAQGWVIKGAGVDRISEIEHIVATDYDDTFILTSSAVTIDAGAGEDTVNLSAIQGDKVEILFDGSGHAVTVEDGSATIDISLQGVENIFSSSADETYYVFEGTTAPNTYSGVYTFQSNNLDAASYVDFSLLSGSITYNLTDFSVTGNNVFASDFRMVLNTITGVILTDHNDTIIGSANISIAIDGGAGTDTIDYSGLSTAIHFNLGTGNFLKVNNNLSDTVSNVEIIVATGSNDVFSFGTDSSAIGSFGITSIDGGGGTDSISFEDIIGDSLVYTSTASNATVVVGSSSLDGFGSILNMEALVGTGNNDKFIIQGVSSTAVFSPDNISVFDGGDGRDEVDLSSYTSNNTITFNSSSVGSITLASTTIEFRNMEVFKLGSGDDTIVAGLSGSIHYDLGAGSNTLDYSSLPVGIVVDFDAKQITKAGTNVDSFESLGQIAEFKGTNFSDTFRVSDVSLISSINIDGGGVDSSGYSTDTDILEITSNSGVTVDLTAGGIGVISNIERIKTGSGDDTFTLGGSYLFQTNAGYFVTVDGGDGTDTADYSSSSNSITFDMTRGIVTRTFGGNSITDTLVSIEAIVGSSGNDVFNAYTGTMSIDGGAGTNDVLNFDGLGFNSIDIDITSKQVSFKDLEGNDAAGLISFDGIEYIVGTRYNDRIDVSNVPPGGFTESIVIDGGAGDDSISFYNKTSSHTLDLSSGTGVNLGAVTLVSFESIQLTTFDDTVIMSDTDESSIDGGAGTDLINYSTSTDSVSVSFVAGYLTKSVGSNVYSNSFTNFEQVTTGSGNDRFILSSDLLNDSTSGSIVLNAGAGTDIMDVSNVSDISFKESAKSTLSSSGELVFNYVKDGGSDASATFQNFESYSFNVTGTFNLEIQQADRTGDISFVPASASDKVNVVFGGPTAYDVVFNAASSLVTSGSSGSNYRILGASSISATGNVGLTYYSSVVNNYDIGFTGTAATSTADYSNVQFASSFKVTSISANGMNFGVLKGETTAIDGSTVVDETLTNVTKIVGTSNADRFDLYENSTGVVFDIDLGGGNAINTLLVNSSTAVNATIDATGSFSITGYNITNGYYIAGLTDLDDTITLTANPTNALEFAGGGGTDKIDYSALTSVDLQVVISADGINVLRTSGGNVLEDKLGEFESVVGSSTDSQNVFIVSSLPSGSLVNHIDGGASDADINYYDSLILTGYASASSEGLTVDAEAGSISKGSSTLTQIIDFKNIESLTLGTHDDVIKLYYNSASSVGYLREISALGGTDTVQIKEGSVVDLSSGLFTISDGASSTLNTYVTGVEVIDVAAAASGAKTTIYVSTATSDTGYYQFTSSGTGLTGQVDINYYNYSSAITVTDIASGATEISTAVGTGKDVIAANLTERAIITGSTYDDTFNVSNFQNSSGDIVSRSFVGGDGTDLINLNFASATAMTSAEITIGSSVSIITNTSSSAIAQNVSEFEKVVIDAGGKDVQVVFEGLNIAPADVAVVNSSDFEVDLSNLSTAHDTSISLSADGTDMQYGFNIYSGAVNASLDYVFYNVNTISYGGKDSGFTYNWVVDDSYLNLAQTSASGPADLVHVSGTTYSTLSFVNLRNISLVVGDGFDASINSYTDSTGTDHDISTTPVAFTQGIYELTLTSGDDVLEGRTVAIDTTAVYDLGFGTDTVEIDFGTFGDASDTISINYIIGAKEIYAAHKDNTGGDFTTYKGASVLISDVGRDTLTLRNEDRVTLTYDSGDKQKIQDNQASSSNIGKDEFIYTHTSATGGQYLGTSVFSLQYERTGVTSYENSIKDWGINNNDGVTLQHLGSNISFVDVYGINNYVLDSSTGAYTIDNTLRFNTSVNAINYLQFGNSWNSYRVDISSWYTKMAEYGDASDSSYKDNPYIMYSEFEIGGGVNTIDFEAGTYRGSDNTWPNNLEVHMATGSDGRILLNLALLSDDRIAANQFTSTSAGANANLIDSEADMAQTAYNTGVLFTVHADELASITGPGIARFDFKADFDTFTRVNPVVSSGDNRSGLSSDKSAYSWDTAQLYDVGDNYVHLSYNGVSDGISFSYGASRLDVDYSTTYFFDGILMVSLENDADTTVMFSINAQMANAGSVSRNTAVTLTNFSQDSMLDFSGYAYNASSGSGTMYVTSYSDKLGAGVTVSIINAPGGSGEWVGGTNFGSVLLPTAYNNLTINFDNDGSITEGMHFYSSEVVPSANFTVNYTNGTNYDISVSSVGSSGTSYTQVQRTLNGTTYATDIYYFDTSSGSISRSAYSAVDDSLFDVTVSGVYSVGYAGVRSIENNVDYVFEDLSNNVLKINSIAIGSTYDLGNEGGNIVINSGIDTLYIGESAGYFQASGNSAVSFGDGSQSFFIGGADYVQAGTDTNYMLSEYADINIVSTDYYETITVLDLGANYQVFGQYSIEGLDYSNLDNGFSFSLSDNSAGNYVTDNYDGSHSAKIGQVQDVKGSLGDDNFSVDGDISSFSIDGSDGLDIVSIANIDNNTTAQDLAESMDNIEILELSNIEQDVFEITVEDIINMTDENNNLVIKNSDEDTMLQIISSNSDYILSTSQDANGNDVYSIYSSSDPSNQIGEVTVIKDNSNNNNI